MVDLAEASKDDESDVRKKTPDATHLLQMQCHEIATFQEIIARHEKHAFAVKTLLAAVIAGLATMAFSLRIPMDSSLFRQMGWAAVAGFTLWTLSHKAVCIAAIDRVRAVERSMSPHAIEEKISYAGPAVVDSLHGFRWKSYLQAFIHPTNWIPVCVALFTIHIMGGIADALPKASLPISPASVQPAASFSIGEATIDVTVPIGDQPCKLALRRWTAPNDMKWQSGALSVPPATLWTVASATCPSK